MTRYTPHRNLPYPEGDDAVAVHSDVERLAVKSDIEINQAVSHATNAIDRVASVETMAGLSPGQVTDAQTANLLLQEFTQSRAALDSATKTAIDERVVPVYATKAEVSDELHVLASPVVAQIIANDPTVAQNAATLAQSDEGLVRGELQDHTLEVVALYIIPPVVPETVTANVPDATRSNSPATVPRLTAAGVLDSTTMPDDVVRTVQGKIPDSALPSSMNALWDAIDATLPPPPSLRPADYWAPVGQRMPVPTPDGSGQTVHPQVQYFPQGLFGYKWWMAVTGYTNRTTVTEDPLVLASHTGLPGDWVVPNGAPFPLDDAGNNPGTGEGYNSDTALQYDPVEGRLYVVWRRFRGNAYQYATSIYVRSTTDGSTFTDTEVVTEYEGVHPGLSPSFVIVDGEWWMFDINGALPGFMDIRKAPKITGPWSEPTRTDLTLGGDKRLWHGEVRNVGDWWLAFVQDWTAEGNGGGELRVAISRDPITGWQVAPQSIVPRSTTEHEWLYKGSLVPYTEQGQWKWRLYYTGFTQNQSWLYYSEVER